MTPAGIEVLHVYVPERGMTGRFVDLETREDRRQYAPRG